MQIDTTERDGATVVALAGKLDTSTSSEAETHLHGVVDAGATRLVIDFGELDFVSSAGLRVLLTTAKRLKAGSGELRVCSLNDAVQEVFDISGFGSLLNVQPDVGAALGSF